MLWEQVAHSEKREVLTALLYKYSPVLMLPFGWFTAFLGLAPTLALSAYGQKKIDGLKAAGKYTGLFGKMDDIHEGWKDMDEKAPRTTRRNFNSMLSDLFPGSVKDAKSTDPKLATKVKRNRALRGRLWMKSNSRIFRFSEHAVQTQKYYKDCWFGKALSWLNRTANPSRRAGKFRYWLSLPFRPLRWLARVGHYSLLGGLMLFRYPGFRAQAAKAVKTTVNRVV